jgi:hypothetical protein
MNPSHRAVRCFLPRAHRRGVATVWMLIVLAVLSALLTAITWQHLSGRRTLDQRQKQLQAVWLARAGVELAAARLLSNPAEYKAESLSLFPGSEVRLTVRTEPNMPNTFVVTSEAHYRTDEPQPVTRVLTRQFRRVVDKERVRLEHAGQEPASAK